MKKILFVEDHLKHYNYFSDLMTKEGFFIYPLQNKIDGRKKELKKFLGSNSFKATFSEDQKLGIMREKLFQYIIDNKLYRDLSLIVLDINLLNTLNDKLGLLFMAEFRANFEPAEKKYDQWSKVIPIIALTQYSTDKYESEFRKYPGYLAEVYNKTEVENNPDLFIQSLNNFHEQMAAIYPLFFDPELKEILRKVNAQEKHLKEIKQISKLILFAEIAQMPANKRDAFAECFTKELFKYCKENNSFMEKVEVIEDSFSEKLKTILNYPEVQALGFITSFISFLHGFIKPESLPEVLDFIYYFVSQ